MARPAEKARAMLNKWVAMRDGENKKAPQRSRRPHLAAECEHLADAERFRKHIVREMSDNIAKIQNPALPENEIREMNDKINKLSREKFHWNKRIHQLGGTDFNALEKKRRIEEGDDTSGAAYKYYGRAKELPGVAEHLEEQASKKRRRGLKRVDKQLTPDYFGWRDEEDGVLLELEAKAAGRAYIEVPAGDYLANVPSQQEIAKILLEEKKKALLSKYAL